MVDSLITEDTMMGSVWALGTHPLKRKPTFVSTGT